MKLYCKKCDTYKEIKDTERHEYIYCHKCGYKFILMEDNIQYNLKKLPNKKDIFPNSILIVQS